MITLNKTTIEYNNLLFCYVMIMPEITDCVNGVISKYIGNTHSLDTLVLYGVLLYLLLKVRPYITFRISKAEMYLMFFAFGFLLISYFQAGINAYVITSVIKRFMLTCFLVCFSSRYVTFSEEFVRYLRISAYVIAAYMILSMTVLNKNGLEDSYSQFQGYQLLDGFALILIPLFIDGKKTDYLVTILVSLLTLATGARGPFVIEIIILIICIVTYSNKQKLRSCALITCIAATMYVLRDNVMNMILVVAERAGFNFRTINAIINGELFYDSGRSEIASSAVKYISDHLILGCGFVNDRIILSSGFNDIDRVLGYYPHNFFLEILMQFGLAIGTFVLAVIFVIIYKTYKKINSRNEKLMYTVIILMAILPLLISNSYLEWKWFYCLLAYSFTYEKRRQLMVKVDSKL